MAGAADDGGKPEPIKKHRALPTQVGDYKIRVSININREFTGFGDIGNIAFTKEINMHPFRDQDAVKAGEIGSFDVGGHVVTNN